MKVLPDLYQKRALSIDFGRQLVLFGAGNIAHKTLRFLDTEVRLIFDNGGTLWGEFQEGIKICKPDITNYDRSKNYIIICSTSFDEISEQLISYGLEPRTDFCVSPVLNDLKILSDIQSISKSLLITSGNPSTILGKSHGGLYQLDVRGGEWNVKQILSGSCHGIIKKDDFSTWLRMSLALFGWTRNTLFAPNTQYHVVAAHMDWRGLSILNAFIWPALTLIRFWSFHQILN